MTSIYNNITEAIGNTPMVKLNKVTKGSIHQFFAKVEYFNPGGSIKDRIALAIIEAAEKRGQLKPGGTLVEATSGNTGLGLAMVAAVKGYKCIFVLPEKMSMEKRDTLRAYGAKVVITPSGVGPDDPMSHYSVAKKIAHELENSFYTNQYHNLDNFDYHYNHTGPEIWQQMQQNVDYIFAGVGTGGTLSGITQYLKEQNKNFKAVCTDPVGSILHDLFYHGKVIDEPVPWKVEGVGEDILPDNCKLNLYDDFIKVTDQQAFSLTRRLVLEEGICVGPSSGLILAGAMAYSEKIKTPSRIVVVMPDSGKAYLSKVFNDRWMVDNGLLSENELRSAYNVEVKAKDFVI